ncbi:hypothetical protein [Vibrio phage pTD1]|uniref:Uncharacterized protein n=1 Tax=Vibrio phage pTD1 TaxID=1938577 RepID=A0A1Q2U2M2_9CAUD|nr:hypothetical protein FDH33_gp004 [Vibrio phage pTD1]BAW98213.1 hypothetical protein [Vibrio phage pTD1]
MTKRLFSLQISKQIHTEGDTIAVFPYQQHLTGLTNQHELTAEVLINGIPLYDNLPLNKISYSLVDHEENLVGREYELNIRIKRGEEIVMVSETMMVECGSRLATETHDAMALAAGWDWLGKLARILSIIHETYARREQAEERTKLFGWSVGPSYYELYWVENEERFPTMELNVCPTNDLDDIKAYEINTESAMSAARGLANAVEYNEWMLSPAFRVMMIEQPIGRDLMHHYQFLVAYAIGDAPALSLPNGLRVMNRAVTAKVRK